MFAIITRRKLLDILYFSVVVGVLYYYSSHLSFPKISIRHRPDNRQHERNFSVPRRSDILVTSSRKFHTHILHPDPPAGFATFSRLYVLKGTLFAVVEDRKSYPALRYLISRPVHPGKSQDNEPTNDEMRLLTEEEASPLLGPLKDAVLIPGFTIILNDVNQYMGHYYHWWGEIILGSMRSYSSLSLQHEMESPLMEPARFIIPNVDYKSWRDPAGIDGPLMRAAFPGVSIETAESWKDLESLQRPFVFERVMVVDRKAAHRHPLSWKLGKMISSTMNITAPERFWEPIRERLVRNLGHAPSTPSLSTTVMDDGAVKPSLPVVLYISRQKGRRSLSDAAHSDLVHALKKLEDEGICKIHISKMESLTFQEQIGLVAKATIMIGVHGNGLTHQLWMPPSPRSTVFEILFPKTYLHDYSMLSRNMGHKHYAVWNDTMLTFDDGEWFDGVEGGKQEDFHGRNIPVDGETVARVVRERLAIPIT